MQYDKLIQCLVLVRLGQELGTQTPLAKAVFQILCTLKDFCP
jgi:hypothetical protein